MLKTIWEWVLTNIFKVSTQATNKKMQENNEYAEEYKRIDKINFNAIFSNKLSNYTTSDSVIEVQGDNKRSKYLNEKVMKSLHRRLKKSIGMSFGIGGVLLVPYAKKSPRTGQNEIYYDIVEQNRMTIDKTDGEVITGATILSAEKKISKNNRNETYLRWTNYNVEKGNMIITQKYTNGDGKLIPTPEFWKDIKPQLMITGVDRVLLGFIKSPVNNRSTNDDYGVPITYGCDETIKEIRDCLKQIVKEFKNTESFIGIDKRLFDKNGILLESGLFRKLDAGNDDFWEIFSPNIRESSYYARLQELFSRLEKEVGVSQGFLTEPKTGNATATEVKRSMYDTFCLVDDMRTNVELGLEDFIYACNVLCNAYNIEPSGEYIMNFDWAYSLLEDSSAEFNQLAQGVNNGTIARWELRNWLKPSETREESEEAIKEIKESNPTVEDLIGNN